MFKTALLTGAVILNAASTPAVAATNLTLEGKIVGFQCGDNCYLTIKTVNGREESGLCVAKECAKWNDTTEMPKSFIGKRVRIKVGVGVQLNGNGDAEGHMISFDSIHFIK